MRVIYIDKETDATIAHDDEPYVLRVGDYIALLGAQYVCVSVRYRHVYKTAEIFLKREG